MKASEISSSLIGKKIQYEKEILTWNGKRTYTFVGEVIGVNKEENFIDITICRESGLPFKSIIHHIGANVQSGYNEIENAKIL